MPGMPEGWHNTTIAVPSETWNDLRYRLTSRKVNPEKVAAYVVVGAAIDLIQSDPALFERVLEHAAKLVPEEQ